MNGDNIQGETECGRLHSLSFYLNMYCQAGGNILSSKRETEYRKIDVYDREQYTNKTGAIDR